ncbi:hypothetical protein ACMT1E_10815 [Sphingomonas flavalba]|uniref:NAD(P)H-dependent amine dehydrogenase family protein n=1 Tax=Sphingomonas flavalba TaxID=2559804 RepID=UPI0039E16F57
MTKRTYRVIQWATGNVGTHALRTIIGRPDLELVGLRVYDPGKVGADAGVLVGGDPVGVLGTDDVDALLAMDADCVCYCALATSLDRVDQALDELCAILASGKNVVAPAMAYYMYPPVVVGPASEAGFEKLRAACETGGTTIHIAGASPGFSPDYLPLALTRASRAIEHIELTEVVSLRDYPSRQILCDYMGFGLPESYEPLFHKQLAGGKDNPYYLSMRVVADAIGLTIDDLQWKREVALAPHAFTVAAGEFPAGGVAAVRGEFIGLSGGKPAISMIFIWRLEDSVRPDWPTGDGIWGVRIDGDPRIEAEVRISTQFDAGRAVSIVTGTVPVNAIPTVCEAPPGIRGHLDLPFTAGGYWGAR